MAGFRKEKKEFQEELLQIARVTRVTAGGRQLRFRAVVVIGNKKGKVGVGVGKAGEVVDAIAKAIKDAKKNVIEVKFKDGTISHYANTKYKSATIFLHPASEGTGIIAGGAARRVLAVSGVKNILAKRHGSTNIINNARATVKALSTLRV